QQVAFEMLSQAGVTVDSAENGVEALVLVEKNDYDCVLMDIQMPEMDGFEATRRIRKREKFRDLPIVAMTANALLDARHDIIEAGMNGHVPKPIDPRQLIYAVKSVIANSRFNQFDDTRGEDHKTVEETGHLPILDRESGLANVNGNEKLYEKLLGEFCQDHGGDAVRIRMLYEAGELAGMSRIVHTLKGLTQTIGAELCSQAVKGLDKQLQNGEEPDAALIQWLEEHMASLCKEIQSTAISLPVVAGQDSARLVPPSSTPAISTAGPDRDALSKLRTLISEMDPDAEDVFEILMPTLDQSDQKITRVLGQQVKNFEFEKALHSLNALESSMARKTANG
ncbi:MAG: response regulator, partial [Pseudomonadales bacterium]